MSDATDQSALYPTYLEDGVVCLREALDEHELTLIRQVFDSIVAEPTARATDFSTSADQVFYVDTFNTKTWETPAFAELLHETRLPQIAKSLLSSDVAWFYLDNLFMKGGADGAPRGAWHQDSTYLPFDGDDYVILWISLDPVPSDDAFEVIRGSHHGALYRDIPTPAKDAAQTSIAERVGDVGDALPLTPDIDANRDAWEIVSWATEPGDIIAFHPRVLHSGGAVVPGGMRRTLTLSFYGEQLRFVRRAAMGITVDELDQEFLPDGSPNRFYGMKPGDPFRARYSIPV